MTKAVKNKQFKDWLYEEVMNEFGLIRLEKHPFLEHLKTIKLAENDSNRLFIELSRLILLNYVDSWNNAETTFMFIAPFFTQIGFVTEHFKAFIQRPLGVKYKNGTKVTKGFVEFMLGKGIQKARKPFNLLLQQYKAEKRDNDPLGQLLIAMVAAKIQNEDDKPIYGIYVNGRNWFFVVLDNNTYAVSNPFVATSDDIFDLFAVLLYFKDLMEKLYSEL